MLGVSCLFVGGRVAGLLTAVLIVKCALLADLCTDSAQRNRLNLFSAWASTCETLCSTATPTLALGAAQSHVSASAFAFKPARPLLSER